MSQKCHVHAPLRVFILEDDDARQSRMRSALGVTCSECFIHCDASALDSIRWLEAHHTCLEVFSLDYDLGIEPAGRDDWLEGPWRDTVLEMLRHSPISPRPAR